MTKPLDARPTDRDRLPPGQVRTQKWPVLHYQSVPKVDLATWRFRVGGHVEHPFELTWEELLALPQQEVLCDMHCVTQWSRLDNTFRGVSVRDLLARAGVKPGAEDALVHGAEGYTTNLPVADLDRAENLVATHWNGEAPHRRAWGPGPAPCAAPLPLEECQVGDGDRHLSPRRAGVLGGEWLPYARRPLAGAALRPPRSGADAARTAQVRRGKATELTVALPFPCYAVTDLPRSARAPLQCGAVATSYQPTRMVDPRPTCGFFQRYVRRTQKRSR